MAITIVSGSEGEVGFGTATPAKPVVAGDLQVVCMRAAQATFVTSIADTAGNAYRRGLHVTNYAVWYSTLTVSHATNVITPTYAGGVSFQTIVTASFNSTVGWDANPLRYLDCSDQTLTTPGLNTYIADALLIGAAQRNGTGSAWTAGAGFTEAIEDNQNVQMMQFQVVSALQSNVAFTITNAGGGGPFIVLAFVETQSGGGGTGGSFTFVG